MRAYFAGGANVLSFGATGLTIVGATRLAAGAMIGADRDMLGLAHKKYYRGREIT